MLQQRVANRKQRLLNIELDDVAKFDQTGMLGPFGWIIVFFGLICLTGELLQHIKGNTKRYRAVFSDAVEEIVTDLPTTDGVEVGYFFLPKRL